MMKASLFPGVIAVVVFLSGCSVGPNYERPAPVALPMDWRWKKAEPSDAVAKGPWWKLFHDPDLDRLEALAAAQNQDL